MKNLLSDSFKDLLYYKKEVGDTLTLFSSQILMLFIGLGIKSIQVRVLDPAEYGLLALFGTITTVIVLFFHYASFSSLKVILANNTDKKIEKELIGLGIKIAALLGIIFSGFLCLVSFFIDDLFNVEIGNLLILLSPLCFILPFQFFISEVSIGSNRLKTLSFFHLFSRILFIVSLFVCWYGDLLDVKIIIIINLLSWFVSTLITLISFKPSFANHNSNLKLVRDKNKSFGYSYYFGAIVNQSTYKLDEIFITYFINITQLGFYTLASIICSPMTFLSRAFINSIFKKLAFKDRIPIRVFLYNTIWLILCVIFLYVSSDYIVSTLFGDEYIKVSSYIFPLSLAFFFQGMYAPFSFLAVKSKGTELRNVAYIEAVTNVIGNIVLVPIYLVEGAIYASIISRFIHLLGLLYYYNKMIKL